MFFLPCRCTSLAEFAVCLYISIYLPDDDLIEVETRRRDVSDILLFITDCEMCWINVLQVPECSLYSEGDRFVPRSSPVHHSAVGRPHRRSVAVRNSTFRTALNFLRIGLVFMPGLNFPSDFLPLRLGGACALRHKEGSLASTRNSERTFVTYTECPKINIPKEGQVTLGVAMQEQRR